MPFKRSLKGRVLKRFADQTKLVALLAICRFRSIVGRSAGRASVIAWKAGFSARRFIGWKTRLRPGASFLLKKILVPSNKSFERKKVKNSSRGDLRLLAKAGSERPRLQTVYLFGRFYLLCVISSSANAG